MFCPFTRTAYTLLKCSEGCAWKIGERCAMAVAADSLGLLVKHAGHMNSTVENIEIVTETAMGITKPEAAAEKINNL